MDEYARPATLDDLKSLLRALNEHGVEYLLIGGYALAAHGYQRATTDIDVLVPATIEVARKWGQTRYSPSEEVGSDSIFPQRCRRGSYFWAAANLKDTLH
jgi:hypothetical protein